DIVTILEDTPASGNLFSNDTDADGDKLELVSFTVNGVTYPAGSTVIIPGVGKLVINADGSFIFTPDEDYDGPVPPVSYIVKDNKGGTATGQLEIKITPVDDPRG
ncbi:MAG: Ig-like domain-containing protein, partial [Sphingobacteriales bacterium]